MAAGRQQTMAPSRLRGSSGGAAAFGGERDHSRDLGVARITHLMDRDIGDRDRREKNGMKAWIGTGDKDSGQMNSDDGQLKKRKFSPIVWDLDDKKPTSCSRKSSSNAASLSMDSSAALPWEIDAKKSPLSAEQGQVDSFKANDDVPASISSSRWAVRSPMQENADREGECLLAGPSDDPQPGTSAVESGPNPEDKEEGQYEQELNEKELIDIEEEADDDSTPGRSSESESDEENRPSTPQQLRYIDMLKGCRSVGEYDKLNKIDEGTYGVVYRARDRKTGEIVALKRVKMDKEREGFPMTSLREINVLLSFHHPSIVDVKEVVVGSNLDHIYMVMEYMEHDLKGLMEAMKQPFSQSETKCLMLQLFEGVKYLHDNWVLHRDLKTSNLLLNNRGDLKICDFGLARQYGSPLKTYTRMVVTLWYRAPELLLGSKKYNAAIDMWSLGCIMAEFLAKEPLFNGKSEIDQLDKIFKTLGTPNEKIWPNFVNLPGVKCNFVRQPYNRLREKFPPFAFGGRPVLSEKGFDLLNKLLTYDPEKRITAEEALNHEWFREVPLPKMKELMPTFPVRSDQDRRLRRTMKSPDPLEEQRKRELRQGEFGTGGVFG